MQKIKNKRRIKLGQNQVEFGTGSKLFFEGRIRIPFFPHVESESVFFSKVGSGSGLNPALIRNPDISFLLCGWILGSLLNLWPGSGSSLWIRIPVFKIIMNIKKQKTLRNHIFSLRILILIRIIRVIQNLSNMIGIGIQTSLLVKIYSFLF